MRVEAVESFPIQDQTNLTVTDDPAITRALRAFLTAIASDDSALDGEALGSVVSSKASGVEVKCAGDFALRFREAKLVDNRAMYFSLLEKLTALLKQAGSAESLAVILSLSAQTDPSVKPGALAIQLRLEAMGNSFEQAALRWGLCLAHVQQAVLFTSRYLRQQLAADERLK